MPAQQDEFLLGGEFEHLLLAERPALGRKIDPARPVRGIDGFDRAADGLRHHDHARAAAEGIVVALEMFVLGIIADVDDMQFQLPLLLRPAEDARRERRKHFGEEGEYGDLQRTATSKKRFLSTVMVPEATSTAVTTPSATGKSTSRSPSLSV